MILTIRLICRTDNFCDLKFPFILVFNMIGKNEKQMSFCFYLKVIPPLRGRLTVLLHIDHWKGSNSEQFRSC